VLSARNLALQEENARAVASERARIARELHDTVSHAIAVTVLQARGGRKMIGRDDEAVARALAAIEQTNTSALADMRRLLGLLRNTEQEGGRAEPQPSLERLDQLVEEVRASGLPVGLEVSGDPLPVSPGLDLSAYRIVQEALTNVLKHAGPEARAQVEVRYGADDLEVVVTNSGQVIDRSAGGHGLIGIRERVGVAGGAVDVGPVDGGYRVHARLPYLLGAS
jgi:signal transduction histidine kinase